MSSLSDNLHRMSNKELNGLAQNRFIDKDIQLKLAQHHYLLCRQHLSMNPSLCREAVGLLMNGKAKSVKWNLVANGHLDHDPSLIEKVYFDTPSAFMQPWRFSYTFLQPPYWSHSISPPKTPTSVLKHAYLNLYQPPATNRDTYYATHPRYWAAQMARSPGCDIELAIRLSQDPRDDVKRSGFEALVRLKREV